MTPVIIACALAAAFQIDASAGPILVAGPETGASSRLIAGPGFGGSLRARGTFYATASLDIGVPVVSLRTESLSLQPDLNFLGSPIATAAVGGGWTVIDEEAMTLGVGAGFFYGTMPYSCGDCFGPELSAGVAPHVFMTWKVTPGLTLTMRAQVPIGLPLQQRGGQPFVSSLVSLEPTWPLAVW